MSTTELQPEAIAGAFRALIEREVVCERAGDDTLLLDTPYAVGNGYSLRAYLSFSAGEIVVSDGGFATAQIEQFIHTRATLKQRYRELGQIAQRLGLVWDGDFSYTDGTLDDAMRRLKLLAAAIQESNALLATRQGRQERRVLQRLSEGFERRGATVERHAQIRLPGNSRPVRVDLRIETPHRNAAVEIIGAQTEGGVEQRISTTIARFHRLANGAFGGLLVGVYEAESLRANRGLIEQFNSAKPPGAQLFAEDEAEERIAESLAA